MVRISTGSTPHSKADMYRKGGYEASEQRETKFLQARAQASL